MANSISPNWHSTLEFLAGMLDEDRATELIKNISNFLTEIPYRSEFYLIERCMAERGYIVARRTGEDCSVTVLSNKSLPVLYWRRK